MLYNFIKGTLRNSAANKTFTAINILGLSVGITCALVISLYVIHETSYDTYHTNANDMYRVTIRGQVKGIDFDGASSGGALRTAIREEIDGIDDNVTFGKLGAWLVTRDTVVNNEDNILFADTNFFSFFDGFTVIRGDKKNMLNEPRTIVFTKSSALKYFNSTNIVGEKVLLETGDKYYTITGVVEDVPTNSHIKFDMVASMVTYKNYFVSWANNNAYNYIKITKGADLNDIETQLNSFVEKYVFKEFREILGDGFENDDSFGYELQPVSNIHLHSNLQAELEKNGNSLYVYAFGIVAILILIIACLNFMNLSSANSVNRSREVVLRKVSGADRRLIVFQFLLESLVYTFIALVLALLLTEIILPLFNKYLDLSLQLYLFRNVKIISGILLLAILLGIVAGSYPAFFISTFDPVKVLNGKFGQGFKNSKLRAVFVILQFFIAALIIILTLVIYSQVQYMMGKELGFDKEHVIVIRRSDALKFNIEKFKKEILEHPDVISATNANAIPGRGVSNTTFNLLGGEKETTYLLNQVFANYDFCKTYNLKITQGRFFDPSVKTDSNACVVNETAAKLMGLGYPIGSQLAQPSMYKSMGKPYEIVGVVKDFHYQSLDKPILPLIICFMPGNWEGYINVKLGKLNMAKTISHIESVWKRYTPEYPFVYFFLDEDFNKSYKSQVRLGRIFIIFSVLSVLVACLGLYGLISFVSNGRNREIGIRKSLGATMFEIIYLLSFEVFKLVSISVFFACIAGYLIASYWLDEFYYRIGLSPWFFIFASMLVMIISLATVILQTYKVAVKEPGVALKYE